MMRKTIYYSVLNAIWTLWYFMSYGLLYGMALGLIAGTGFFPLAGTLIGLVIGVGIGAGSGFVIGVGVAVIHALTFDRDTDLERYRRQLAKGVGAFVAISTLIVAVLGISTSWHAQFWRPLDWVFPAIVVSTVLVWTTLSSAYTASYYPDRIVARLIHQKRLQIDSSMMTLGDHEVSHQADILLKRFFTAWMYCVAFLLIGSALVALVFMPAFLTWVMIAAWAGVVGMALIALLCGGGNAALLVFLKRLVMPEMPPERYRVTLTLISFFYTLVMHWWTLIFAPVIALFIAYHVYHTLALPDFHTDKAKRKEMGLEGV